MANRHLLRSTTMQILYQIDVTDRWFHENLWDVISESISRFSFDLTDTSYIKEVIFGIIKNKSEIDETISKYSNGWNIETISLVERNILRIALFEILFYNDQDIPFKVAINEAIELSKMFSGKPASKFINGVLGGLVNDLDSKGYNLIDTEDKKIKINEAVVEENEQDIVN